jgi:hypothetical protein
MGVRSRRATFERALRAAALDQPGLQAHRGHVDSVICRRGRAGGVCVDGSELPADLVIDAPLESASPALRARQARRDQRDRRGRQVSARRARLGLTPPWSGQRDPLPRLLCHRGCDLRSARHRQSHSSQPLQCADCVSPSPAAL